MFGEHPEKLMEQQLQPDGVEMVKQEILFLDSKRCEEALKDCGRFIVNGVLGKGSFGVVFKVRDIDNEHLGAVAAKVVRHVSDGEWSIWPSLQNSYIVRLLERLPLRDEHIAYLMPFVGKDLYELVYETNFEERPDAFDRKKKYMRDSLRGLQYLHANHLVHRDLKEENVMVDQHTDTAMLGDFSTLTVAVRPDKFNFGVGLCCLPPEMVSENNREEIIDATLAEMWTYGILTLQVYTKQSVVRYTSSMKSYDFEILPFIMSLLKPGEMEDFLKIQHPKQVLPPSKVKEFVDFLKLFLDEIPYLRSSASHAQWHSFVSSDEDIIGGHFAGGEIPVGNKFIPTTETELSDHGSYCEMYACYNEGYQHVEKTESYEGVRHPQQIRSTEKTIANFNRIDTPFKSSLRRDNDDDVDSINSAETCDYLPFIDEDGKESNPCSDKEMELLLFGSCSEKPSFEDLGKLHMAYREKYGDFRCDANHPMLLGGIECHPGTVEDSRDLYQCLIDSESSLKNALFSDLPNKSEETWNAFEVRWASLNGHENNQGNVFSREISYILSDQVQSQMLLKERMLQTERSCESGSDVTQYDGIRRIFSTEEECVPHLNDNRRLEDPDYGGPSQEIKKTRLVKRRTSDGMIDIDPKKYGRYSADREYSEKSVNYKLFRTKTFCVRTIVSPDLTSYLYQKGFGPFPEARDDSFGQGDAQPQFPKMRRSFSEPFQNSDAKISTSTDITKGARPKDCYLHEHNLLCTESETCEIVEKEQRSLRKYGCFEDSFSIDWRRLSGTDYIEKEQIGTVVPYYLMDHEKSGNYQNNEDYRLSAWEHPQKQLTKYPSTLKVSSRIGTEYDDLSTMVEVIDTGTRSKNNFWKSFTIKATRTTNFSRNGSRHSMIFDYQSSSQQGTGIYRTDSLSYIERFLTKKREVNWWRLGKIWKRMKRLFKKKCIYKIELLPLVLTEITPSLESFPGEVQHQHQHYRLPPPPPSDSKPKL